MPTTPSYINIWTLIDTCIQLLTFILHPKKLKQSSFQTNDKYASKQVSPSQSPSSSSSSSPSSSPPPSQGLIAMKAFDRQHLSKHCQSHSQLLVPAGEGKEKWKIIGNTGASCVCSIYTAHLFPLKAEEFHCFVCTFQYPLNPKLLVQLSSLISKRWSVNLWFWPTMFASFSFKLSKWSIWPWLCKESKLNQVKSDPCTAGEAWFENNF